MHIDPITEHPETEEEDRDFRLTEDLYAEIGENPSLYLVENLLRGHHVNNVARPLLAAEEALAGLIDASVGGLPDSLLQLREDLTASLNWLTLKGKAEGVS